MPPSEDRGLPGPGATKRRRLRLRGWHHPAILSAAALSAAAGFAQFSAVAALGDIARSFGDATGGASLAEQAGLSGTTLGMGLGVIRLASLASLPLAGLADRLGRRRVLLACCGVGLAVTVVSAGSPGFWWFVAGFALARPLLSATNAIAGVVAAEETSSVDRAKAIVLVTAGYGAGSGLTALLRGVLGDILGFRTLFLLAVVPLALLPVLGRSLEEPERFRIAPHPTRRLPVLRVFGEGLRARLGVLAGLSFAFTLVTGPQNSYLFLYGENVLGMRSGTVAATVLAAAPLGLLGLVVGRWCADHVGRRLTAATAQIGVAAGMVVTYSGSPRAVVGGYLLTIVAASGYAPSAGALAAELFPTSVRATAAGWLTVSGVAGAVSGLLAFGALADALGSFSPAATALGLPLLLAVALFPLLPETRGLELEESAPEPAETAGPSSRRP